MNWAKSGQRVAFSVTQTVHDTSFACKVPHVWHQCEVSISLPNIFPFLRITLVVFAFWQIHSSGKIEEMQKLILKGLKVLHNSIKQREPVLTFWCTLSSFYCIWNILLNHSNHMIKYMHFKCPNYNEFLFIQ